jgi:molybdenum-dependent DNA-binding transcriptional regulator ModE
MELRHLRYFVAVAEELNFTRAAERLGISQPPLSLQIRQFEKEIGTPLLRRGRHGVELTDAGKLMLEEARVILKQVEQAKTGVQRRARGETGQINLGSSGGVVLFRSWAKRHRRPSQPPRWWRLVSAPLSCRGPPAGFRPRGSSTLRFAPRAFISLAYRQDDPSPSVQNFVAVARRVTLAGLEVDKRS